MTAAAKRPYVIGYLKDGQFVRVGMNSRWSDPYRAAETIFRTYLCDLKLIVWDEIVDGPWSP